MNTRKLEAGCVRLFCRRLAPLLFTALCTTSGCRFLERNEETDKPPRATGPASSKAASFTVEVEGAETLSFQRQGDEIAIRTPDNGVWGTLKLDADRVKLDQGGKETAKAKAKDYGFKVYDGDRVLFKVKRKGASYEVRRADDTPLGRIESNAGRFGNEAVTFESASDAKVLERGGRTLVTVRGALGPTATLMLAVTEATLPQRLVMASIVEYGIAP